MMQPKNLLQQPITELEAIKKLLPHRKPMLMVDGLKYYDGIKAISTFTVLNSDIFVENNYFSESGLIEHMAQTAALLKGYKHHIQDLPIKEGFIASIKHLIIENLPKVDEEIITEAQITYELGGMTLVNLNSKVNEISIATTEMTLVLKENV